MGYLTWWSFPKKAWFIILGELGLIISLSISLYMTYLNDAYFQSYANGLSPILVPVLSVAFGISSASIATYLYLGMRRIRLPLGSEPKTKARGALERTSKRHAQTNASELKTAGSLPEPNSKLRPIAPIKTHSKTQKPQSKEREKLDSNSKS